MDRVGRFRIVQELGRGAMGVVYKAIDPTIGRAVAIKTIRLREVDDSEQRSRLRERLFREARSAGVLSHPNIVTIYDMDEEDGLAFIAMQFVNGPTVEAVLDGPETEKPKPLEPERIFRILRQTASALDFAHARGIVHRDIKPANIMIDEDGSVKIADFGIAKASASGNLTGSGTILGTPNYMSPEQVQGTAIDGRSDQFSLGVVAYEILTGERPFEGENLGTVIYRIVAEPAREPAEINPALGPEIGRVLQKVLQKNPKRRFLSCTEFVNALIGACELTPGWHGLARTHGLIIDSVIPPSQTTGPKLKRAPGVTTGSTAAKAAAPASFDTAARQQPRPPAAAKNDLSLALPMLGAFAVVLGVLGLVAWQTNLSSEAERPVVPKVEVASSAEDVDTPPPADVEPDDTKQPSDSNRSPAPAEALAKSPANALTKNPTKTPPDLPAASAPAKPAAMPDPRPKRSPFGAPVQTVSTSPLPLQKAASSPGLSPDLALQDVWVVTNPVGATATLDGHADSACQTPCALLSEPGVHTLFLTLKDFQPERRQLRIADAREDVPLIVLRPLGGLLMISTVPAGANIFVNDTMLGELTPARISLQAGHYTVAVERDGARKSQQIVVKNGATNYLRIPLLD